MNDKRLKFNFFFFFVIHSEVEQSLAGLIADRATDEVVEALTRYRRGLGISDSPSIHFEDAETPDVVRSRSNQDPMGFVQIRDLDLPRHMAESPTVSHSGGLHRISFHFIFVNIFAEGAVGLCNTFGFIQHPHTYTQ